MGVLSRDQMEQVIRSGGSVLHGGRLITRVEQLPTDADLAKGNPEQEAAARTALDAQIAALQQQRDRLDSAQPVTTHAAPSSQEPAPKPQTVREPERAGPPTKRDR